MRVVTRTFRSVLLSLGASSCTVLAGACANPARPAPDVAPAERALRERLGIPLDAERVIMFGQNAHLDIDWQHTFDDYYALFVADLLT